jgi:hypothetical protein
MGAKREKVDAALVRAAEKRRELERDGPPVPVTPGQGEALREAAAGPGPPPAPKQKPRGYSRGAFDARAREKGRLPDGSAFQVRWAARVERWSGVLTVPTPGRGDGTAAVEFRGEAGGVFRLLESLDNQYRDWLAKEKQPAGEPTT